MGCRQFSQSLCNGFHGTINKLHTIQHQSASCPTVPAFEVRPNADQVRTLLIKPGDTFDAIFNRPRGHFQPRGFHHRSQKIKSPFDSPDECLVGMLLNLQLGERFIDDPGRRTQLPAHAVRGLAHFSRDKVKIRQIAQTIHSSFCRENCACTPLLRCERLRFD